MAFGGFNDDKPAQPMSEINVTPMVDVMLVLLVIFIISAPLFTHAIRMDLPAADVAPAPQRVETVIVAIDGEGQIHWNDTPVTQKEMAARFSLAAKTEPQPELQLRADKATRYEVIAQVMAAAQNNGLTKIGFVTEPVPAPAGN
jgi:biopolymer transport protein ExbD